MRGRVHGVVQELGRPPGAVNPVGELPLDGDRLKIAGHLVEHQVGVAAAGRHDDDLGLVLEIKNASPCPSRSIRPELY